jgi:predicted secreted protein
MSFQYDPGSPATHRVWPLGWTTVVATVIFGILYTLCRAILFRTTS